MMDGISRCTKPKYPVQIEWQDENYIYISSSYTYKELQPDVEALKVPITIHFTKASQPL